MKYYAIKRPDGSWIMCTPMTTKLAAWYEADKFDSLFPDHEEDWCKVAKAAGYTCVEVSGFVEVK